MPAILAVPQPVQSLEIRGDDMWAEAGRRALGFHLERMLQHVPGVLEGRDSEEVHQMRLSARRMRAAWRVFGDGFQAEARRRYVGDLRTIGAGLGVVRDLDVQFEILGRYRERHSRRERRGLEPLIAAWRAERESRHAELTGILRAAEFASLVEEYRELTTSGARDALPVVPHAPATVRLRIASRIWGAYQVVWAFDGPLESAEMGTLHELRIAAKWLRYTLEFARLPLEPEAGPLIRKVVALQDHLGDLHDLDIAARRARGFVEARQGLERDELRAVTAFVATADLRVARLRGSLWPKWCEVAGAGYRRRLGRGLGAL